MFEMYKKWMPSLENNGTQKIGEAVSNVDPGRAYLVRRIPNSSARSKAGTPCF